MKIFTECSTFSHVWYVTEQFTKEYNFELNFLFLFPIIVIAPRRKLTTAYKTTVTLSIPIYSKLVLDQIISTAPDLFQLVCHYSQIRLILLLESNVF